MSAWMITDAHLDLLAAAYVALVDQGGNPQRIGEALAIDNAKAIRARYEDRHGDAAEAEAQAAAYRFRAWPAPFDPFFLAKQAVCYRYQCAEFDGWEFGIGPAIAAELLKWCKDQGADFDEGDAARFDPLPWGIDECDRPQSLVPTEGLAPVPTVHPAQMSLLLH